MAIVSVYLEGVTQSSDNLLSFYWISLVDIIVEICMLCVSQAANSAQCHRAGHVTSVQRHHHHQLQHALQAVGVSRAGHELQISNTRVCADLVPAGTCRFPDYWLLLPGASLCLIFAPALCPLTVNPPYSLLFALIDYRMTTKLLNPFYWWVIFLYCM